LEKAAATGAKVVAGFVLSDEFKNQPLDKEAYITALYRVIFNREPDEAGLKAWLSVLNNGSSGKKVLAGFLNSHEFKSLCDSLGIPAGSYRPDDDEDGRAQTTDFVTRLYQTCMNRPADSTGLNDWVAALTEGRATGTSVVKGFFNSKEFAGKILSDRDFVNSAYRTLLDRDPDAKGLSEWLKVLNRGSNRSSVLNGFLKSVEFGRLCDSYGILR
jgi:hypothetical protein